MIQLHHLRFVLSLVLVLNSLFLSAQSISWVPAPPSTSTCSYFNSTGTKCGFRVPLGYTLYGKPSSFTTSTDDTYRYYYITFNSSGSYYMWIGEPDNPSNPVASTQINFVNPVGTVTVTRTNPAPYSYCETETFISVTAPNSNPSSYANSYEIEPSEAGNYSGGRIIWNTSWSGQATLTVTAYNEVSQRSGSISFSRTELINFNPRLTFPSTHPCEGDDVNYNASVNGTATFKWYIGTDNNTVQYEVSNTNMSSFNTGLVQPGETVRVNISPTPGLQCVTNANPVTLSAIEQGFQIKPKVYGLTLTGPQTICQGASSTQYTANANSAESYSFNLSDPNAGIVTANGLVSWSAGFSGMVNVIATAYGCGSSSETLSIPVAVQKVVSPFSIAAEQTTICNTQSTRLIQQTAERGVTYRLYLNEQALQPVDGIDLPIYWTGIASPGIYKVSARSSPNCPEVFAGNTITIQFDPDCTTFTRKFSPVDPFQNESNVLSNALDKDKVNVSTEYVDGLGRPVQTILRFNSPGGHDLVANIAYDNTGRTSVQYLPITTNVNAGYFKSNFNSLASQYYDGSDNEIAVGTHFSKTIFEKSPLDRPLKVGYAGADWQPSSNDYLFDDHTEKIRTIVNGPSDVIQFIYDPESEMISAMEGAQVNYFTAGDLVGLVDYDEENNQSIEFKDKLNRTICRKVQHAGSLNAPGFLSTYYIYDKLGNLLVVLPPEAVNQLTQP